MLRGKEDTLSLSAQKKGVIQFLHRHWDQHSVYGHKTAKGVYQLNVNPDTIYLPFPIWEDKFADVANIS